MNELRWGFVGAGAMAQRMASAVGFAPSNRLVGVAARDQRRAASVASRCAARAESSIDALLHATDIDIVYIATPPHTHADLAVAAMIAGKHVLVEKPFATSTAEAQRIVNAAQASGQFCMEAMWTRFLPAIEKVLAQVSNGSIGEVRQFRADFSYPVVVDPSHHLFSPQGGGALLDRGVYGVFLATAALGPVVDLTSRALIGSTGVDEDVTITMRHESGALSSISASLRTRGSNEAFIQGTNGTLTLHEPFFAPARYSLSPIVPAQLGTALASDATQSAQAKVLNMVISGANKSAFGRQSVQLAKGVAKAGARELKTVKLPFDGDGYSHQVSAVQQSVQAGLTEEPRMTLQHSLIVMDLLDQARASW